MGKLSGEQIKKLAVLLSSTLSFDDLEIDVQASTGDRLYDAFVGKGKPKLATIINLLNALEDLGTTSLSWLTFTPTGREEPTSAPKSPGCFPRRSRSGRRRSTFPRRPRAPRNPRHRLMR